ncbi:ribulose-phosphate 3-epimerase [Candidatus Nitrospira salsa]|nr:MAG: ribulose-phosphate 3-epimerase [Nitrospirales bacterium]
MVKFAPSILAANFLYLGAQLKELEAAGANRIHIDVMDGHFVPNLSLGIPIVEAVRQGTTLPVEVHLMIEHPERYLEDFTRAGSDQIIVHQEVSPHLHRTIQRVKDLGKKISVALNPATPVLVLDDIFTELDTVLIMTVNPGFGGQRFIESTLSKIRHVRQLFRNRHLEGEVEVDGGVDLHTAPRAIEAGADVLVAGSSIFNDPQGPGSGLRQLQGCCGQIM